MNPLCIGVHVQLQRTESPLDLLILPQSIHFRKTSSYVVRAHRHEKRQKMFANHEMTVRYPPFYSFIFFGKI